MLLGDSFMNVQLRKLFGSIEINRSGSADVKNNCVNQMIER